MSWGDTLRGVAYGDAWGAGHEFWDYSRITGTHGPHGPDFPTHAKITDDTQMTLALADALQQTDGWTFGVEDEIVRQFLAWLDDPDNTADRAPGSTCLSALETIEKGEPWWAATVMRSKGCGTVMRTAPAAFLGGDQWRSVAAFQSVVTHGHPTATVSCVVLTGLLREAKDVGAGNLVARAIELVQSPDLFDQRTKDLLHPMLDFHEVSFDEYVTAGRREVLTRLRDAQSALAGEFGRDPWHGDICAVTGQGWIAEEALAGALLAVDLFPTDPVQALRRAVVTGGDSDSLGAVAGSIIGSAHENPWPVEWANRLEARYADWIGTSSAYWP